MQEENINTIMSYIQEYPDQTTESLVQSLITAGYQTEDIAIALGRLGLSPLSIPGYKPSVQPPVSKNSLLIPGRELVGVAGAGTILMIVYFLGNTNLGYLLEQVPLLGRKPQLSRPVDIHSDSSADQTIIEEDKESPIASFREQFANGTFKVVISQINDLSDNPLELTYYTENGYIDRHDNPAGMTYIVRTTAFYTVDNTKKTYSKVDSTDFRYGVLLQSLQDGFIVNELVSGENSKVLFWEKQESNIWIARNTLSKEYLNISFDNSGLLQSITLYNEQDGQIGKYLFTFEPITITDDLLTVPEGYKEIAQLL